MRQATVYSGLMGRSQDKETGNGALWVVGEDLRIMRLATVYFGLFG